MLGEFPDQILVTELHVNAGGWDPWTIPFAVDRAVLYQVDGVPTVIFDGVSRVVGATSCGSAAAAYRERINQRLSETGGVSPVRIRGDFRYDDDSLRITATFEKLDPVALENTEAFFEVLENHVFDPWTVEHLHVVRAGYREGVTLTEVGDQVVVTHAWPRDPAWSVENLDGVAFLQNMTSRDVYQSARVSWLADYAIAFDEGLGSAPGGYGTVLFHGRATNIGAGIDQLTFSLNDTWGWTAQFMVEGDAGFHTDPVTKTLAPGDSLEVWVEVATDDVPRIGAGDFVTESANTGRPDRRPLRVFNGSPAILVVDTDSGSSHESVVLNALTAGGYLYDHWDVVNGHGGITPRLEEALPYDLMLWDQNWTNAGLPATDQTTIMGFMDAGRGVILSGQDYLNGITAGAFASDYLGVASWVANQDADQGIGIEGDPISAGMNFTLSYPQWNLDRADNLTASGTGTIFLLSEEADRIAVRNDNGTARSVFFTYALNAMPNAGDPNNVKTLLDRSIEWVRQSSGATVDESIVTGRASRVLEVGPNPFSPLGNGSASATILLRVSDTATNQPVRLDVVDLSGRRVRSLLNAPLGAGLHRQSWDGRDGAGQKLGAGVYYIRFADGEGTNCARLVMMP